MCRSVLRAMLRTLQSSCLALALSSAGGAFAAPVMTFTSTSATSGIADAFETQWADSTFIEDGERHNFAYMLRDVVEVRDGIQSTYHFRDVSYDVAGYVRDWSIVNVDGTASGAHSVRFASTATLDTTQAARLADGGDPSFQVFLSLLGSYTPVAVPGQPGLQPPPPVFTDTSAGTPAVLPATTTYDPEALHYNAFVVHGFTAPLGAVHDVSYLIEGNGDLLSNQAAFALYGPRYDAGIRTLSYSELLGVDVIPVPEPRAWMMLLAGVGILALGQRSRATDSPVFRK